MQFIRKIDTLLLNLLEIYTNLIPWPHFGASGTHFGPSWPHFGASGLILDPQDLILDPFDTIVDSQGAPFRPWRHIRGSPGRSWDSLLEPWGPPRTTPEGYPRSWSNFESFWLPKWRQNGSKNDSFSTRFLNHFSKQQNDEKSTSCNLKTIIDSKRM